MRTLPVLRTITDTFPSQTKSTVKRSLGFPRFHVMKSSKKSSGSTKRGREPSSFTALSSLIGYVEITSFCGVSALVSDCLLRSRLFCILMLS
jgi:hypothetical protein